MGLHRRTFLRGLGGSILGSRLLDATPASAQVAEARRLIVMFSSDGTQHDRWRPTGGETDFAFPAGSILEPLTSVRDQLTILDGIRFAHGREHFRGMWMMLTNSDDIPPQVSVTDGASVDQHIAHRIGDRTPYRSLELGVQCSIWGAIPESRMCYRRTGEPVPPNEDPHDVYRRLFGGERAEIARRLRQRRSVLDLLRAEVHALEGRLGAEERRKLDVHLDALRDVERGISANGVCEGPVVGPSAHLANDNFPAVGRAQTDLMIAALACDLTRVATLQWSMGASPTVFSWLGHAESHHTYSHVEDPNSPGLEAFVAGERWYAEQFRYLVERLAALPEPSGGGSMLDHSLVLWITEIGDRLTHVCEDVPIVLAGSGGGRLRPGRYLRYNRHSHGQLFTALCQAMGLDTPSFGDARYGSGPLQGLLT